MADFKKFSQAVHQQFTAMSKGELFIAGDGRELYDLYLKSFPEGTNPVYKTNTEHDCNCCKQFIRTIGTAVSIKNGVVSTVWNVHGLPHPYNLVALVMDRHVQEWAIKGLFRVTEPQYGSESTLQQLEDKSVKTWNHFHGKIAAKHLSKTDTEAGDYMSAVKVFERGLTELSGAAIDSVLDLIDGKLLYRGEEHRNAVSAFRALQTTFNSLDTPRKRELFLWENAKQPGARFRNTVIGTLVQDLSEGKDMEQAVRSFEQKVAPTNYKRPTALITPAMVTDAMKTITTLGLEDALKRRFAVISDITVNNVLWVDGKAKSKMKGGLEDLLMGAVKPSTKAVEKATDLNIADFMEQVLPKAQSMEMLVSSLHLPNFVSLTAPVHPDLKANLFKWPNEFAWSYDGNITDSIKDKVKAAGGNVTNAALRVSLAWTNHDDLDIHLYEPGGNRIYFGDKIGKNGRLDVDMNAGQGTTRTPVENISFVRVADGVHKVFVNQYRQRETQAVGFVVEVENQGKITQFSYPRVVKGMVPVVNITVKDGKITEMTPASDITGSGISREKWGIQTEVFTPVQTFMYSPNHWDGHAVGNRHWLFILEGCKNPEPTRGIYNEFLNPALEKHRKVFEVLGDKTKCQPTAEQLSGLGFSSTKSDTVTVKVVSASGTRLYNVNF